ncbi:Uncharacterised protein [Pandoraea pulmonicola]|uniref:Uncharacterized protein n=1 Tax=Pandoraea pulmonicola TaxID=93221 RepID=A0AAJ4ZEM8_PANPU|nr:Uncharacterised protein [Pandoraea pulmonicola]
MVGGQSSAAYSAHTCPQSGAECSPGFRGGVGVGPAWAGNRGPIPELFVRAHLARGSVFVDPTSTAYRAHTCPQWRAECSPGFRGGVGIGSTWAGNRGPIPELLVRAPLAWGSVFVDPKSMTYRASLRPAVPVGWFVGRRGATVAGPNSTTCCIFSACPEAPVESGPRLHNVLAPSPRSMACRMARRPYPQIAN